MPENKEEEGAQCTTERSLKRAIYFANDDELGELGGALDTTLPSENLANKQWKQERGKPRRRETCINVSKHVSGIKIVEYISGIDVTTDCLSAIRAERHPVFPSSHLGQQDDEQSELGTNGI